MEDNSSKFGTLVRVKRPLLLDNLNNIAIQIGRTVMSFSVKKNSYANHIMFKNTDVTELVPDGRRPEERSTLENILYYQRNCKIDDNGNIIVKEEDGPITNEYQLPESEYN